MAVEFDAGSQGHLLPSGGSTITISHTCAANSVLYSFIRDQADVDVSTVKYNSVDLSLYTTVNGFQVWRLVTPSTGTYNLVVTMSGSIGSGTNYVAVINGSFKKNDMTTNSINAVGGTDYTPALGAVATDITPLIDKSMLVSVAFGQLSTANATGGIEAVGTMFGNIQRASGVDEMRGAYKLCDSPPATQVMRVDTGTGSWTNIATISLSVIDVPAVVSDTATATEVVSALRDRLISVANTASLSDMWEAIASFNPWKSQPRNPTNWTNQNKS